MFKDGKEYDHKFKNSEPTVYYKGKTVKQWAKLLGKHQQTVRDHLNRYGNLDRVTNSGTVKKGSANHMSRGVHTPIGVFETMADACEAYGKNRNCTGFVKCRVENPDKYPDWYMLDDNYTANIHTSVGTFETIGELNEYCGYTRDSDQVRDMLNKGEGYVTPEDIVTWVQMGKPYGGPFKTFYPQQWQEQHTARRLKRMLAKTAGEKMN